MTPSTASEPSASSTADRHARARRGHRAIREASVQKVVPLVFEGEEFLKGLNLLESVRAFRHGVISPAASPVSHSPAGVSLLISRSCQR